MSDPGTYLIDPFIPVAFNADPNTTGFSSFALMKFRLTQAFIQRRLKIHAALGTGKLGPIDCYKQSLCLN